MTLFIVLAALMLGLALAFLLLPLLRNREPATAAQGVDPKRLKALGDARDAGVIDETEYQAKLAALGSPALASGNRQSRRPAVLASLFVAVVVPLGAIMLYQFTGEPAALDPARLVAGSTPAAEDHGIDMDQAIAGLVSKLKENPDNAEGWALLGRAYQSMGKFGESRDALKKAWQLVPDNHDLTVEYAQALALSQEGRRIDGESRTLIEGVLKADPDHQRALWLIGISDYQAGDSTPPSPPGTLAARTAARQRHCRKRAHADCRCAATRRQRGRGRQPVDDCRGRTGNACRRRHRCEADRACQPGAGSGRQGRSRRDLVRLRPRREWPADAIGNPAWPGQRLAPHRRPRRLDGHDAEHEAVDVPEGRDRRAYFQEW
jgi:cytochrome c-type biogenesis protein CcmI